LGWDRDIDAEGNTNADRLCTAVEEILDVLEEIAKELRAIRKELQSKARMG